jgi:4-carboxymuconolactone decarboxylase
MEKDETGFPPHPDTGLAENLDHCYRENFKKIYSRDGLPVKKRLLCAISALTARGDGLLLENHLRFALEKQIGLPEICETLLQTYLFVGFPGAYQGFRLLAGLAGASALPPEYRFEGTEAGRTAAGEKLCEKVYGRNYRKLRNNIAGLDPDFASWMISEGYGKVLSRPFLTPRDRELITVAALVVMGRERQLRSHIEGALNLGCTPREVREAILQTYLYAGFPPVIDALILFREIMEKRA